MKRIFLILFLALLIGRAGAQVLTIEQAVATALQYNYDIRLSKNDSMVAALNFAYRNAALLPSLNIAAGTAWNTNNQQLKFSKRAGGGDSAVNRDAVRTHNINYAVNLNWVLFDGLKMFVTREKSEEFVRLGELRIRDQVLTTIASVIQTYYDIVRQKQQLKAIEEQIILNEERVKLAQYKLDIGTGAKPDLLQSKVDLNTQRSLRLTQQTLGEQLKEQLNQVMNTAPGSAFEVPDTIPLLSEIALGDIQASIEKSNPALLFAQKNIDIARLTLRENKADLFPTLSFNSAYSFNRNNNSVAVNLSQPFYNQNKGFSYGFTANIPVFNQFRVRRQIKQSELDINYYQLVYERERSLLNLGITNAYKSYLQQKNAMALEEESVTLARENVQILFQSYRLGVTTQVQLREAMNSLELANNRLIAARYATKLAETELLRIQGSLTGSY